MVTSSTVDDVSKKRWCQGRFRFFTRSTGALLWHLVTMRLITRSCRLQRVQPCGQPCGSSTAVVHTSRLQHWPVRQMFRVHHHPSSALPNVRYVIWRSCLAPGESNSCADWMGPPPTNPLLPLFLSGQGGATHLDFVASVAP
jgi:hypothetical protein